MPAHAHVHTGTAWGNQYDSGYRGDCVVQRQPPCCGQEPNCKIGPQSPLGCITRDPDFIPKHNSSATCVCADTYIGIDCGSSLADEIIAAEKAKQTGQSSGCFALGGQVRVLDDDGRMVERRVGDVKTGDLVRSIDSRGRLSISPVVFIHDHLLPSDTMMFHFIDTAGAPAHYELTGAHAVPTALACEGLRCKITRTRPAREIVPSSSILRVAPKAHGGGASDFEVVNVTHITHGYALVRYIVTAHDTLVVNDILSVDFSTSVGALETLPFRLLYAFFPSLLSHPAAASAISTVLESPLLKAFEYSINSAVDWLAGFGARRGAGGGIGEGGSAPTLSFIHVEC